MVEEAKQAVKEKQKWLADVSIQNESIKRKMIELVQAVKNGRHDKKHQLFSDFAKFMYFKPRREYAEESDHIENVIMQEFKEPKRAWVFELLTLYKDKLNNMNQFIKSLDEVHK